MSLTFRHPDILRIARAEGRVSVEALAARFGVTQQTIRRDLAELTQTGALTRVHGGAILPPGASNLEYDARRRLNAPAKAAIAHAAAAHIPNGACVFLDIGTTSEAVARALSGHEGLMVVTNNLHVARIIGPGAADVVITGGTLRQADMGLVGPLAVKTIETFRFDHAILGCSALHEDGEMLDFDLSEVAVSQALLRRAGQVTLVADASKFQRTAPVRIGAITDVARVITDAELPTPLAEACARAGTQVERVRVFAATPPGRLFQGG